MRIASMAIALCCGKGYSWRGMVQKKHSRVVLKIVVLAALGMTSIISQPITENFQTIKIDPATLEMKLEGPLPLVPTPVHDFYQRFRGNTISVVHSGPDGSMIAYNAFDVDRDGKLITRGKTQVLSQGPYGTVFAQSTYYYATQYNHAPTDFHAELYFNEGSHEPAQQVETMNEVGALSAISVVRIFKAAPGYLIACATYDASGRLLVLSINGSKDGNWVHSNNVFALYPGLDFGTIYEDRPKTRQYFGLPESFPLSDYLKAPYNVGEKNDLVSFSDTVNFHYQRNRHVRQDVFSPDGSHQSHSLTYTITAEDQQLEPIDATMKFGR